MSRSLPTPATGDFLLAAPSLHAPITLLLASLRQKHTCCFSSTSLLPSLTSPYFLNTECPEFFLIPLVFYHLWDPHTALQVLKSIYYCFICVYMCYICICMCTTCLLGVRRGSWSYRQLSVVAMSAGN